jgi:hypothetical protein
MTVLLIIIAVVVLGLGHAHANYRRGTRPRQAWRQPVLKLEAPGSQ